MKLTFCVFGFVLTACLQNKQQNKQPDAIISPNSVNSQKIVNAVGDIEPLQGFNRILAAKNSFADWLRNLKFKKDKTVYLFNGEKKQNQSAQFAVIDISTGKTDLQQCADVVMRLRAEYLFAIKKFDSIRFMDYDGKWYNWNGANDRKKFESYLQTVFGCCGSASLEKQLKPKNNFYDIQIGDVLVKGGFPGHAMIVADMAANNQGEKIFMLIQGYQPAQDIHLVINPADLGISPWYRIPAGTVISTPEWTFYKKQLHCW